MVLCWMLDMPGAEVEVLVPVAVPVPIPDKTNEL